MEINESPITFTKRYLQSIGIDDIIPDEQDRFEVHFDDKYDLFFHGERDSIICVASICEIPIKTMAKERLYKELAQFSLGLLMDHRSTFFIDEDRLEIMMIEKIDYAGIDEAGFDQRISGFISVLEDLKKISDNIIRMAELCEIPVEFRN